MYQFNITKCRARLKPYITKTPIIEWKSASDATGSRFFLKLESFQRTGAFKFRGAMNYLLSLTPKNRKNGVVTASSGNHGLGISLGSKILGIKCTVVMPERAPKVKQEKAKNYGSQVVLYGETYDEAAEYAEELGAKQDSAYVPSFNNPCIMEGQGTILAEILEDLPDTQCVMAPIGGGGLIAGLLIARDQLKPDLQIIGVEPVGAASMKAAVDAGRLVTLDRLDAIADGVAVKTVGDLTFEVVNEKRPFMVKVSDSRILEVQKMLLMDAKVLAESAAAVSVAAALDLAANGEKLPDKTVCVVTGGNIDIENLRELLG